jgi:hypothetical protein
MGEVGWDNDEFKYNTKDMSDDEEAPGRIHEDKLDKAGIWQDSSSPPRRLVFSPSATQVLCPRPSIVARLGDPPDITDRLSIILNKLPPVSTPTPVPLDQLLLDEAYTRGPDDFTWVESDTLDFSDYDSDVPSPSSSHSDGYLDGKDHGVDHF